MSFSRLNIWDISDPVLALSVFDSPLSAVEDSPAFHRAFLVQNVFRDVFYSIPAMTDPPQRIYQQPRQRSFSNYLNILPLEITEDIDFGLKHTFVKEAEFATLSALTICGPTSSPRIRIKDKMIPVPGPLFQAGAQPDAILYEGDQKEVAVLDQQIFNSRHRTRRSKKTRKFCAADLVERDSRVRGISELNLKVPESLITSPDKYKTSLCIPYFSYGSCAFGDKCRYMHSGL